MKPILSVNYLASRREYFDITAYFLNGISEENKKKIHVNFLHLAGHQHLCENRLKGISWSFQEFRPGLNYMDKIHFATRQPYEYSMKLDEDIFLSTSLWNYLIENVHVLDDPQNVALAPLLSNGIPTTDQFVKEFFNEEDREQIYSIILKTHIPNIWGVNYESLNQFTTGASSWDSEKFYGGVRKINHYYKGIHPVRVSLEAQSKILELLLKPEYIKKFCAPQSYEIQKSKLPYMCNSAFFIKTELWKKLVNTPSLFRDEFDECNLNLYFEQNNLDWNFVKNGFGIHTMYNTVNGQDIENQFYPLFKEAVENNG